LSCNLSVNNANINWRYLLTPWCRVLLEKLTGLQLVKKFPAFHGTRRLPQSQASATSRRWVFLNKVFLQGGVVSTSTNPQAGGLPLVGCPRLLIQFIRSYSRYRRPFLYPQPEDAPCRGDSDPLHGDCLTLPDFSVLSYKRYGFGGKNFLNVKWVFWFLPLTRIQRGTNISVHKSPCKVPVILVRF